MKKLLILDVSSVKTEKERSDKKVSRKYVTIRFADKDNPLTSVGQRNFFQNHSADGTAAFWKGIDPSSLKKGMELGGEIVRLECEAYEIGENTANSATLPILAGEHAPTVFKAQGYAVKGGQEIAAQSTVEAAA